MAAPYTALPVPGHKLAPEKFKGHYRDLDHFITHYDHVCAHYNVTEDRQKCRGIIRYCSHEVADIIEKLDSYKRNDYDTMITKIRWHFDEGRKKTEFDLKDLEDIVEYWQDEIIRDLETFKEYELDFIQVAEQLKDQNQLSELEYNRKFWEGLHRTTRSELERRMREVDPRLRTDTPFPHEDIVEAAEQVYSRKRFDKYLRKKEKESKYRRTREPIRKRLNRQRREDDTDTEADDSDKEDKPPRFSRREKETPKTTKTHRSEATKVKTERDEIAELVKGMENLSISQPAYRTLYVRLSLLSLNTCRLFEAPAVFSARTLPNQNTRFAIDERPRRDLPPHQAFNISESRMGERREFMCYGCGERGHRMDQCTRLEMFIDQGRIRRVAGRIRWADGSNIIREPEETWANAIERRIRLEKGATSTGGSGQGNKGVYLLSIQREDSDADTDEQEELGWRSGTTSVNNLQAYQVERTPRIS